MQILVIGSGGREHAICSSFAKSARVSKIYCAPGNAGIAALAGCVAIRPDDVAGLADLAAERRVDLTFVGGETSLALGITDEFERRNLRIIGPSRAAARLEASKAFAKEFMARHSVPTAYAVTADSADAATAALNSGRFGGSESPVVVKADGLAAGKGVVVAANRNEAIAAIGEMAGRVGSEAADRIVLEECLFGREVSLLMFADGTDYALMPPTRDHKRIGDGDTGPNTGGMGTITDAALLNAEQMSEIRETIIEPTLAGCVADGFRFRGILFLGLMMTQNGPKLLEYNVRFGDPETQSILVRLRSDMVEICEAMIGGELSQTKIEWEAGNSACVVLAAEGYPDKPRLGDVITGVEAAAAIDRVTAFHSGTARNEKGEFVTAGGRVLGVTATGDDLRSALESAYDAARRINWPGMQYRKDIGRTNGEI